jgi:hypothetical protein
MIVLLALAVMAGGALSSAVGREHEPNRLAPLVLHPKWRLLAPSGIGTVEVGRRYVYIGEGGPPSSGSGTVIDQRTGKTVTLTPPTGCSFSVAPPPLGGSWVVATCTPPPLESTGAPYQLYSIPNRTWTPLRPDVTQMCGFNWDCKTGDPECFTTYSGIGDLWIAFVTPCGYHHGPVTSAFQQLETGQVIATPAAVQAGGNEIVDLNSPTATQTLCSPLRVPNIGTIIPDGLFAVDKLSPGNVYLERCGSSSHRLIARGIGWFGANSHAVLGFGSFSNEFDGVFLPSLRRFKFRLPQQIASACNQQGPSGCVRQLALTSDTLYVVTTAGQLWTATSPVLPPTTHKKARR